MAEPLFTCPQCGHTSNDSNDARQGYCRACEGWTGKTAHTDRDARPKLPSRETESEWLARIRQGDKDAFASLFRTYYNRLCHYTEGYVGSPDTAEDLVEEIFTALWANRDREIVAIRRYLYHAARNRALKHIRDHRKFAVLRRPRAAGEEPVNNQDERDAFTWYGYSPAVGESNYVRTDQRVLAGELAGIVRAALASLTNRQREAFLLARQHGLSHAEIADTMGISVSTVEKHVLAAARRLRDYVAQRYELQDDQQESVRHVTFNIEELDIEGEDARPDEGDANAAREIR